MSFLRLLGVAAGVLFLSYEFYCLRTGRRGINPARAFLGLVTLLVAAFPTLTNLPAEMFSLLDVPGGRIITLLILVAALALPVMLTYKSKVETLQSQVHRIALASGVKSFNEEGDESDSVWVVIPVLNEAENLRVLLPKIPEAVDGKRVCTVVVDDGSTDGSARVARELGARVAELPANFGGGLALKVGFELAVRNGAGYVVTIDGDNQHDPADIRGVVEPLLKGQADLVIGSRHLGEYERVTMTRSVGLHVFNSIINVLQGTSITDCASGFRAVTTTLLGKLTLTQRQYHTAELIIASAKQGARIDERPITVAQREFGQSKKGRDLFYGFCFLRTVISTWLK